MKKNNSIMIGGKRYPAELTAGALLRFKREAGYDFLKEPERLDAEGVLILAWAAVKSTARRDGGDFGMDTEEMADAMSIGELNGAATWLRAQTAADGKEEAESKKKEIPSA